MNRLAVFLKVLAFQHKSGFAGVLCALILGLEFFFIQQIPQAPESNVVGIRYALNDEVLKSKPASHSGPQAFCEAWTGGPSAEVDCLTGLSVSDFKPRLAPTTSALLEQTKTDVNEQLRWMKGVLNTLDSQLRLRPQQANLVVALGTRIAALETLKEPAVGADASMHYQTMFRLLLLMDGVNYDSMQNTFRPKQWDIARLFDQSDRWVQRGTDQELARTSLPWLVMMGSIVLLTLAYWRAGLLGIFCIGMYLSITSLSLLIASDAAMHFGINSLYYHLNPLGNQMDRQLTIQLLGYAIIAALLLGKGWIPRMFNTIIVNQKWSVVLIAGMVVCAYTFLRGPALGSEALKIGLACLAGALMADQGRILHLVRKYAPQSLQPVVMWNAAVHAIKGRQGTCNATHRVLSHVALPLLSLTGFGFAMLAMVALVFHDLGGALIAALLLITSLFLVFGSRPAFLSLAVMACAGVVMGHTEKVQKRIELMLDPMTAAISDFARLNAFSDASAPSGFGFGRIAWCNEQGTCLPLQVLSDYIPTLLDGLAGPLAAKILFLILCLYFTALAGLACWRFLTGHADSRAISMATFFLLLASLLQTIITFFGNWRLIPLTGLGVPLLGIGISTMLAPTLAIGFLLISQKPRSAAA